MKIAYHWLLQYLPLGKAGWPHILEAEEIAQILTSVGLEVEQLTEFSSIPGALEGLVVGEVEAVWKHPDADKLQLTRVKISDNRSLQIVCGAPNVAVGQKVVVALPGTTLHPLKGEPFQLKTTKIRGQLSEGMLCAADEIGLAEDHSGILVLDATAKPGSPLSHYIPVFQDRVFEIGLTPNRMDAMSHIGVARDICAYVNHHHRLQGTLQWPSIHTFPNTGLAPSPIQIEIVDPDACLRYAGLLIEDVQVGPSPAWLQAALESIGIKPINNVVDITNYVLHECGQPLHAFNADAIIGNCVRIRKAQPGEHLLTLDGKDRSLYPTDLMICDAQQPMCIAGVFGGVASGIQENTRRVFLESAVFHPASIRQTSLQHGLRTEAALRFEKGVDISRVLFALKRAALLIRELAGGQIRYQLVDLYPHPPAPRQIRLTKHYLFSLSGKNYPQQAVENLLEDLEFELISANEQEWIWQVPPFKHDVKQPADLVEEIMRIDGLDQIPIPSKMHFSPAHHRFRDRENLQEKLSDYLVAKGFSEIYTNSISNSQLYTPYPQENIVHLLNHLNAELDVLRPSMLENGLACVAFNQHHRNEQIAFFEFGKTYHQTGIGEYAEQEFLSIWLAGDHHPQWWAPAPSNSPPSWFFLKTIVDNICRMAGISLLEFSEQASHPRLNPCLGLHMQGEPLGILGAVDTQTGHLFDMQLPVYYAELAWHKLVQAQANTRVQYQEIIPYPVVRRDISFLIDREIPYAHIHMTIASAKVPYLIDWRLIDLFESAKLEAGKKSCTLSLFFQHPERTLTEKDVDQSLQQMIQTLEQQLHIRLRQGNNP
ncbi:MAG: phenylalanine--tRNA ligase subunit beta [Thermoflavifilum sp.]|nr:phenylalanine--tRNA ligase subunit beta [Thermoflavifilum sp.]